MRKLKLQMNIALDNKWDSGMSGFSIDNLSDVDCIYMGEKQQKDLFHIGQR